MSRKILVVDDDVVFRALMRDTLEVQGCEVVEAHDGAEAFSITREQKPDLIDRRTFELRDAPPHQELDDLPALVRLDVGSQTTEVADERFHPVDVSPDHAREHQETRSADRLGACNMMLFLHCVPRLPRVPPPCVLRLFLKLSCSCDLTVNFLLSSG